MRKCSVRWYSSSSLRYCFVSVSRRKTSISGRAYRIQALHICYMLVDDELELARQLRCSDAAASTWSRCERHVCRAAVDQRCRKSREKRARVVR